MRYRRRSNALCVRYNRLGNALCVRYRSLVRALSAVLANTSRAGFPLGRHLRLDRVPIGRRTFGVHVQPPPHHTAEGEPIALQQLPLLEAAHGPLNGPDIESSRELDPPRTRKRVTPVLVRVLVLYQRLNGLHKASLFDDTSVTLDTRISQLTPATRSQLSDVASSLNVDPTLVTPSSTLRDALRLLAAALPPRVLKGEVL